MMANDITIILLSEIHFDSTTPGSTVDQDCSHIIIPPIRILSEIFKTEVNPSNAPFLSYVLLKAKFENLVCKISKILFELELSYMVY